MNWNNVTYFDCFGIEYIQKEIKKILEQKKYHKKYLQTPKKDSVMCGYFNIRFITFMVKGESLLD